MIPIELKTDPYIKRNFLFFYKSFKLYKQRPYFLNPPQVPKNLGIDTAY